MQKLRKLLKDKRGVMGLNTIKAFLVGILGAAIIGVAVLITLSALDSTSLSTNQTTAITNNVSVGVGEFFGNSSTYFTLLGVVVIILIIAAVVIVVNRFGQPGGNVGI